MLHEVLALKNKIGDGGIIFQLLFYPFFTIRGKRVKRTYAFNASMINEKK